MRRREFPQLVVDEEEVDRGLAVAGMYGFEELGHIGHSR
jgi:hypothetical protein